MYTVTAVFKAIDDITATVNRITGGLRGFGASVQDVGRTAMAGLALVGVGAAAAGLALSKLVDNAAELQRLTVSLETLAAREIVVAGGAETIADAMGKAVPVTQNLLAELRDIALISPFEYQDVANVFRVQLAFGATSDQAMGLTSSILDTGSAMGWTNEQLDRSIYNLSQAMYMGDLTAANLRQLKMVGLDLAGILEGELGMSLEDIRKGLDAGTISSKQLGDAFSKYAGKNFAGAAERMSRTFSGLKSSFADLIFFAAGDLLTPALEIITSSLGGVFDAAREIVESGKLKEIGAQIGDAVARTLGAARTFVDVLRAGRSPLEAFGAGLMKLGLPPATLAQVYGFVNSVQSLIDTIRPYAEQLATWIGEHVKLQDVLMAIGIAIASVVIPAILPLVATFAVLVGAVALLRTAWEENWGGIQEKTMAVIGWVQANLPILVNWLQTNIPIAVQTASDVWNNTLYPALQQVWGFIQTSVIPAISQIVTWLQVNIPIAAQAVSDTWNNVLLPAFNTVAGIIMTYIIPNLQNLGMIIQSVVGAQSAYLAMLWNSVLYPALRVVANFVTGTIIPVWKAVADVIGAVVAKAVTASAGLWQNVLLPAIRAVYAALADTLVPIFNKVADVIKSVLSPAVSSVTSTVLSPLVGVLNGISSAAETVVDWLHKVASAIRNMQLPDFLTPGSPTPFEMGLRGIGGAMEELSRVNVPEMSRGLQTVDPAVMRSRGGASAQDNRQWNIPITVEAASDPDATATAIQWRLRRQLAFGG